ncbi:MAG: hypothetical protein ACKPKO_28715, partial [Candidatus Fonsibacter sp.]
STSYCYMHRQRLKNNHLKIKPIYIYSSLEISSNADIYNARVGTILWNGICRQCVQGSGYGCGVVG